MQVKALKTRLIHPPQDNLDDVYGLLAAQIGARSVVAVTSKIVAIEEGRCVAADQVLDKDELVMQEADRYLPRKFVPGEWVLHTLKDGILAPSCGVDESNADGYYIMWPASPTKSAERIWHDLSVKSGRADFGVILTDSRSVPLRRGVTGYALASFGIEPLIDYRHTKDLFDREIKVSQTNVLDGLAAAATLVMGEGAEQTPLALLTELPPSIKFRVNGSGATATEPFSDFIVPVAEDLYEPFINGVPWQSKQG